MTRTRRLLRAAASFVGLVALVGGLPALLIGVVGWPLPRQVPGPYGPSYQVRSSVVRPGGIGLILGTWQERLPIRTQHSCLLAARAEARSASIQSGAWPPDTGT